MIKLGDRLHVGVLDLATVDGHQDGDVGAVRRDREPSPLREPSGFFHRAENLDDPIDTRTERCSEAGHHLLKGIVATPQGLDACYC